MNREPSGRLSSSEQAGPSSREGDAESLVGHLFREFVSSGTIEGVYEKLDRADAFRGRGSSNVFSQFSRSLIDTLAKYWSAGETRGVKLDEGSGGSRGDVALSTQLAEKRRRHMQFLDFLTQSKCHEALASSQKSALLAILEHGEKLAAVSHLRSLHNAGPPRNSVPPGSTQGSAASSASSVLWEAVQLAGSEVRQANALLRGRESGEVFYTRVSEVGQLFSAVQLEGEKLIGRGSEQFRGVPLGVQASRLCQLADALTGAVQAALQYREAQRRWYPDGGTSFADHANDNGFAAAQSAGGSSAGGLGGKRSAAQDYEGEDGEEEVEEAWTCCASTRAGLSKLASLCLQLREEARASEPSAVAPLMERVEELAALLLDAFALAIDVRSAASGGAARLEREYAGHRNSLLRALRLHARERALGSPAAVPRDPLADGQQLPPGAAKSELQREYAQVAHLARQHCGYEVLYDMCDDLQDWHSLRSLMRESTGHGGAGRFSRYVFERHLAAGQHSRLLRYASDFPDGLAAFLQDHPELEWLHDFYLGRFGRAAGTLRSLALSPSSPSPALAPGKARGDREGGVIEGGPPLGGHSLAQRRQLLCLAKLSVLAEGAQGAAERAARIDADLALLSIQEAAARLGLVGADSAAPARQLAEACLGSPELFLRAFEVFCIAGPDFCKSERRLVSEAWLRAAEQDPWAQHKQQAAQEGWTDGRLLEVLGGSVLCAAARCCYGAGPGPMSAPGRPGVGSSFADALPMLVEEESERAGGVPPNDASEAGSVEGVLAFSPQYEEAGEEMVGALRLGRGDTLANPGAAPMTTGA